jgi:hypothetical protein
MEVSEMKTPRGRNLPLTKVKTFNLQQQYRGPPRGAVNNKEIVPQCIGVVKQSIGTAD